MGCTDVLYVKPRGHSEKASTPRDFITNAPCLRMSHSVERLVTLANPHTSVLPRTKTTHNCALPIDLLQVAGTLPELISDKL